MTALSDYGDDDDVYDPDTYIREIIADLRRDAEGFKIYDKHAELGLRLLQASDAMEDLLNRNDELLDKLMTIEYVVHQALKNP